MSDNPLIDIPVDVLSEAVLPPIIKVPVSSSAISYATYIKTERLLTLEMHDGTQIEYYDVPPHTFLALMCQSALKFDPGSASNLDPCSALGQVCPGSEQEGPARSGATAASLA